MSLAPYLLDLQLVGEERVEVELLELAVVLVDLVLERLDAQLEHQREPPQLPDAVLVAQHHLLLEHLVPPQQRQEVLREHVGARCVEFRRPQQRCCVVHVDLRRCREAAELQDKAVAQREPHELEYVLLEAQVLSVVH